MAQSFREALLKIKRVVAGYYPPLIARISKGGDLMLL